MTHEPKDTVRTSPMTRRRKFVLAGVIAAPFLFKVLPVPTLGYPRCTGTLVCFACKNCSRCQHCRGAATCGVCRWR